MAIQERPALTDRVYELLQSLQGTAPGPVGPDTELSRIGFDSLASAEFSAAVERELGVDLVDAQLAELRRAREVAELVERTAVVERRVRESYPHGMGGMQQLAGAAVGACCGGWLSWAGSGPDTGPAL